MFAFTQVLSSIIFAQISLILQKNQNIFPIPPDADEESEAQAG